MSTILRKVGLAISISAAICTQTQAESFADALSSGKFSGEIRNVYAGGSYSDAKKEAGALNNAHVLGSAFSGVYTTGDYNGFKAVVGFQAGHDWEIHDKSSGPTVAGGEDDARVSISSTELHRAYLEYNFDKAITQTQLRIGRQKLVSPLVMNSGVFPMQDSFEALVIENKDLPETRLQLMYINSWIMRYGDDSNGSITQSDKEYDDPVYSLHLVNKSLPGLNLEAQWLHNGNDNPAGDPPTAAATAYAYDTGFIGLTYKIPNSSWELGAKALTANYDKGADTGYWGIKAKTRISDLDIQLAYTSVQDDASFPGTLGHVPMFRSYKTGFIDEIFAGLDTTAVNIGYDFGIPGLKANLVYSGWRQSDAGIVASGKNLDGGYEAGVDIKYAFQKLAGLSARIQASYMDFDQTDKAKDDLFHTRMTLNYAF